jgi:hypothetical protein
MRKMKQGSCNLTDLCVYTIKHSDDLKEALEGGSGTWVEGRPWATAWRLLEDARHLGQRVPIIFAPAEATRLLFAWALLDKVEIDEDSKSTTYTFSTLRAFYPRPPKTTLRKRNGEPFAPHFIRPYAICFTPDPSILAQIMPYP